LAVGSREFAASTRFLCGNLDRFWQRFQPVMLPQCDMRSVSSLADFVLGECNEQTQTPPGSASQDGRLYSDADIPWHLLGRTDGHSLDHPSKAMSHHDVDTRQPCRPSASWHGRVDLR
jgi:hypothetical protein